VVHVIVQLIVKLCLTERIINELPATEGIKEAETNAKIINLLKEVLAETKRCQNDHQRIEYHIALGLVMAPRDSGWIRRICERLSVQRGKCSTQLDVRRHA